MARKKVRYVEPGMAVKSVITTNCVSNDKAEGFEDDNSLGNGCDYQIETSMGVWEEGYLDDDNRLCIGPYPS